MGNEIVLKGVTYELFSVEKRTEGGRYSFAEIKEWAKENGIKINKSHAYSPCIGQYGLYVEKKFSKKMEEHLWG